MNMIEQLEAEEVARVTSGKEIPEFSPGDTLSVNVRIREGDRERVQRFEGVCIARAGKGLNESFPVRKISFGEGVEHDDPRRDALKTFRCLARGGVLAPSHVGLSPHSDGTIRPWLTRDPIHDLCSV